MLLKEITAAAAEIDKDAVPLDTVYFGGGTPSLLQPHQVGVILETVNDRLGSIFGAEITLEMDPGTFDRETVVTEFAKVGINRVSLGVR